MKDPDTFHVYHNEHMGWWVADSAESARKMAFVDSEYEDDFEESEMVFVQEPDEKTLDIDDEIRTCGEWCKELGEEGFLGSEE